MAGVTGLEPATPCVTGRYSNQTELHPHFYLFDTSKKLCDICLRKNLWWSQQDLNL